MLLAGSSDGERQIGLKALLGRVATSNCALPDHSGIFIGVACFCSVAMKSGHDCQAHEKLRDAEGLGEEDGSRINMA